MTYCARLTIVDPVLNQEVRPDHLRYVQEQYRLGHVLMAGPFTDGSGGMVVYHQVSQAEAEQLARRDPAVASGARTLTLVEWNLLELDQEI